MRLTARGDADPAVAWERYERFALWPTWAPQIVGVRVDAESGADVRADDHRLAAGVTGTVLGPAGVRVRFRVDEVDAAARRWSWTVRPAGLLGSLTLDLVRLRLVHGVDGRPGGGSVTTLDVHGPLPVVASYAPLALVALRRLVRA